MSKQMDKIFDGANKVVPANWTGLSPDMAKAAYGLSDITLIENKDTLIGTELCIIGYKDGSNSKGPYTTFLFIPRQDKLALGLVSFSSTPFCDMIKRSKLPVKGVIEKTPCKKGSYWNLKS
jgi:hypothetical protein